MPVFSEPVSETQDYLVKGWNRLAITKSFWKFTLVFLLLCQCLVIWFSPTMIKIIPQDSKINAVAGKMLTLDTRKFFEDVFGIRYHGVFVDRHKTAQVGQIDGVLSLPLVVNIVGDHVRCLLAVSPKHSAA